MSAYLLKVAHHFERRITPRQNMEQIQRKDTNRQWVISTVGDIGSGQWAIENSEDINYGAKI